MVLKEELLKALSVVIDPDIRRPITDLHMITQLEVSPTGHVGAVLKLTIAGCPAARSLEDQTRAAILAVPGVSSLELAVEVMTPQERQRFTETVRGSRAKRQVQFQDSNLTRVIAVTSGKGGVGKSTVTVNLAAALAHSGYKVGVIDADIFGFSIPHLFGLTKNGITPSPLKIGDMILAPEAFGIKVISIGMFLGDKTAHETAISWRGPMLHRTIEQFLTDVWFGDLDFLLIDLPPGTGDIALSISQLLPNSELLVVTTPQITAADVAIRSGILGFEGGQKVLGVVENMSGISLPDGSTLDLFGSGGGAEVAKRLEEHSKNKNQTGVKLLAQIPLSPQLRQFSDDGRPIIFEDTDDEAKNKMIELAGSIVSLGTTRRGKPLI